MPALHQFGNVLPDHFDTLGPCLELWAELADEVSRVLLQGDVLRLSELAAAIKERAARSRRSAATRPAAAEAGANRLRVACAGPDIEGRQKEFAAALTAGAGEYGVGGRMLTGEEETFPAGLGELLAIPSPFHSAQAIGHGELLVGFNQALEAGAEIVLLDFFSEEKSFIWEEIVASLDAYNALVLGSVSNFQRPVYPGWFPALFTVGPISATGEVIYWDPQAGKPDLFARDSVADTPLAAAVHDPAQISPPLASLLHVLVAAVLVWATDRRLKADQVRQLLEATADPVPGQPGQDDHHARRLNLPAALRSVRGVLIREALAGGPLSMEALVAAVPLQTAITVRLVDDLAREGKLRKSIVQGIEQYGVPGESR